MATHASILAREIPWTEESGGLQSMGSQRVGHDWATEGTHTHTSCATSWNKQWINIIKSEGIAFHVPFVIYFQAWGTKSTGFSSWLLPFTSMWSQLSGPTRHTQAGEPHHLQHLVSLWGTLAAFLRESSYSTDSFSKSLPAPNILKLHWKQSHKALHSREDQREISSNDMAHTRTSFYTEANRHCWEIKSFQRESSDKANSSLHSLSFLYTKVCSI